MNKLNITLICLTLLALTNCSEPINVERTTISPSTTFKNPLRTGADPWIYQKDGFYYYTQTSGNSINIWKTKSVSELQDATPIRVWTAPTSGGNSKDVWAPELHFINKKWYLYYTAGDGTGTNNPTQRLWVLENSHQDPTQGVWVDKGRLASKTTSLSNLWAIDGSILEHNNELYFIWCTRPVVGEIHQSLYISKMENPWTLVGETTKISDPEALWEKNNLSTGHRVNEGPQSLKAPNGKQHIVFSASSCHHDYYSLGLLTLKDGGNPLVKNDWEKHAGPVFSTNANSRAYGTGHNGFFKSPDGKEDWIVYHANSNPNEGCGGFRNIRIQKFTFDESGYPNFGIPAKIDSIMAAPSF